MEGGRDDTDTRAYDLLPASICESLGCSQLSTTYAACYDIVRRPPSRADVESTPSTFQCGSLLRPSCSHRAPSLITVLALLQQAAIHGRTRRRP